MRFDKSLAQADLVGRLDCEVTRTFEGKIAMLDRVTREVMHPVVGARAEAETLYAAGSGLEARLLNSESIVLYDVGFGAGSNALAALSLARRLQRGHLSIFSFDRSLNGFDVARTSPEREAFGFPELAEPWESHLASCALQSEHASLRYLEGELPETLKEAPQRANIVFWDPFSPDQNPRLWGRTAFSMLRERCAEDVLLVTYSSATRVRSALLLAGFHVGIGPTTCGSRPTTVAALTPERLSEPLGPDFAQRVSRSSAPFPSDAGPSALDELYAHPQMTLPKAPPE